MQVTDLLATGFTAVSIPLTKGKWALIDIQDAPFVLSQNKWHAHSGLPKSGLFYARTWVQISTYKKRTVLMHRLIMGLSGRHPFVDHRDGDGLNNRRSNIRLCTQSQNTQNMRRFYSKSGFKGVHYDRNRHGTRKWQAEIMLNGKKYRVGRFRTREEAAEAYDHAAKKLFGEFAAPNSEIQQSGQITVQPLPR